MELIQLNKDQIASLYNEHMVHDFKKDELKPLKMILKALDRSSSGRGIRPVPVTRYEKIKA